MRSKIAINREKVTAFAPSNIALIKYWGKRDKQLNLPVTSSLSISLGDKGTTTTLGFAKDAHHVSLNGRSLAAGDPFVQRLSAFLNHCRPDDNTFYRVDTQSNIPVAAGLASSASGFAALVKALNQLHKWDLSLSDQSVLARLGSGSACRSFWDGFVEWQCGERDDGMDSLGKPLHYQWPTLRIGLLILAPEPKFIGSRESMNHTVATSRLYHSWPHQVQQDLFKMHQALREKDFDLLGGTAERNAIMMHETMLDSQPPVQYSTPETLAAREKIQDMRAEGISVYFTQDAGPNLKLLFEVDSLSAVQAHFPDMQIVQPIADLI